MKKKIGRNMIEKLRFLQYCFKDLFRSKQQTEKKTKHSLSVIDHLQNVILCY